MEKLEFENVTFAVDDDSRTIKGLVVPWSAISSPKGGKQYRFARESIKAVAAKFIKFFEDHSPAKHFGRAVDMTETDAGLEMTFKVNPGAEGDRILASAKSGAKTGLSVGVEFDESDTQPDPEYPGAFLVKLANLFEVSLVERPAYDNARVITVMASADLGDEMDKETTPAVDAAKAVQFSIPEGYTLVPNKQEAPAVVEPRAASTQVSEPANYRFDANDTLVPAKHDFGIDIIRAMNPSFNDLAARQRVEEFLSHQFDVASGDVNEIAPSPSLPRYVDQRDFRSPVWNAIFKGNLPAGPATFDWPKFSSSSGLVSVQSVEGTEPDSGTYTTTNQTVTPSTIHGKAKITRQTWDLGGTPGISDLIWRQMLRGWQEGLEARAIAVLDAASPASLGTLTAGGGTTGQTLAAELRKNLAKLHFVRGGFRFDTAFAQVDLYTALIDARDTTGRALYPALGPNNADGTVSNLYAGLYVNGVPFYPSWALAATGSVAASSYLIDRLAVDGWATAPRQLLMPEIEVANVYLGIWGYAAAAINDIDGVREISYDPVA